MLLLDNLGFNTNHDVTSSMPSTKKVSSVLNNQGKSNVYASAIVVSITHQECKHIKHAFNTRTVITHSHAHPPIAIDTRDS